MVTVQEVQVSEISIGARSCVSILNFVNNDQVRIIATPSFVRPHGDPNDVIYARPEVQSGLYNLKNDIMKCRVIEQRNDEESFAFNLKHVVNFNYVETEEVVKHWKYYRKYFWGLCIGGRWEEVKQ